MTLVQKSLDKGTFILKDFKALGTSFWVECFDNIDPIKLQIIEQGCISILHHFENRFSRFREDSLISLLNKGGRIYADRDFELMYQFSEQLQKNSKGAFSLFLEKNTV